MNKVFIIISSFLVLNLSLRAQEAWMHYYFENHNFKVNFYSEPKLSVDTTIFNETELLDYYWELNVSDSMHPNSYYSLSLTAYPSDYIHSDSMFSVIEEFINSTQYSLLEDSTITMLSSTLIEKNGYPGKVFKWKNNENDVCFEFRVYMIENKLFQLSVVSRYNENYNYFINGFFDSFELVNLPQGPFQLPENESENILSIKFPGTLKEEQRIVDSEYGKLKLNIRTLEPQVKNDNLVYISMETIYESTIVDQNNTYALNALYKKSIDRSLSSVNGELISIKDVFYKGKLGKEYSCYYKGGKAIMVYRFFYIDSRLFSFGVVTTPEKANNKAMNKFFNSFKIKE